MKGGDQRLYFGRHHDEDPRWLVAQGRECVHRPGRDHEVVSFHQPPDLVAVSHVELARQDAEGFLRSVVDVGGSLIARIRIKIPSFDHEVRHGSGL